MYKNKFVNLSSNNLLKFNKEHIEFNSSNEQNEIMLPYKQTGKIRKDFQ